MTTELEYCETGMESSLNKHLAGSRPISCACCKDYQNAKKGARPIQSEHINADGEFQSDKYPWCAPGFVPLKLTDKMAHGPLMAYAQVRAMEDVQFGNDLVIGLAIQGYRPAIEAVGMVNGEPTKTAFYDANPSAEHLGASS